MRTTKPFSTISYNTPTFLDVKLGELVSRRKIDFYAWIEHEPEEDEEKRHKHLLIIPNGQVDTDQIMDYLVELDPSKPDKPLKCICPRSSKFGDWYLYALHDTAYLSSKGQARTHHYTLQDFHNSDNDYFKDLIHTIDYSKITRFTVLQDAINSGISFKDLVRRGAVPIQQIYAFQRAYEVLQEGSTDRNGRETHTPIIDRDTGEIKYND